MLLQSLYLCSTVYKIVTYFEGILQNLFTFFFFLTVVVLFFMVIYGYDVQAAIVICCFRVCLVKFY